MPDIILDVASVIPSIGRVQHAHSDATCVLPIHKAGTRAGGTPLVAEGGYIVPVHATKERDGGPGRIGRGHGLGCGNDGNNDGGLYCG